MIGQFRFMESVDTRERSRLKCRSPDRPTDDVPMDKSLSFYVLVIPHDRVAALGDVGRQSLDPGGNREARCRVLCGWSSCHGERALLVRASQLYQTIHADGTVTMSVDVVNEGTRRLDNVEMKADAPLNWTKTIDPGVVPQLDVSGEQRDEPGVHPTEGNPPRPIRDPASDERALRE